MLALINNPSKVASIKWLLLSILLRISRRIVRKLITYIRRKGDNEGMMILIIEVLANNDRTFGNGTAIITGSSD